MTRLVSTLVRAGGWPRMLLLGGCTAVVSGLLLVVVAVVQLPAQPDEDLFALVAETGLRGGTSFATVLLTLPPLLLLYQAVRLGTAARERRLASLRLAGATPAEVRLLGLVEVAVPAFVGSVAGIGVYGVLRSVLGGGMGLVPTTVAPAWWQACLVVAGVTALAVLVGLAASRGVIVTPLGVSRRAAPAPPRPWGFLGLLGAALLVFVTARGGRYSEAVAIALVGLAVLGITSLASWVAYRVGRIAASRTSSPAVLLASARIVAEPRPVGRAAAAVGGIAMVAGGAGTIGAEIADNGQFDSFWVPSLVLVAVTLFVALLVVVGTLAVHSVESLLDRKRSTAALTALGTPAAELERARRWEATLVAMPVAAFGVLLGSLSLSLGSAGRSLTGALTVLLTIGGTLAMVWLAIVVAVWATRPWATRAAVAGNLRTE
jgi:hypothetical protein